MYNDILYNGEKADFSRKTGKFRGSTLIIGYVYINSALHTNDLFIYIIGERRRKWTDLSQGKRLLKHLLI